VCLYVLVFAYTNICFFEINRQPQTLVYARVCVRLCVYTCVFVHAHAHIHACTHTHTHTHTHTRTHTHTHAHTHTHIHTSTKKKRFPLLLEEVTVMAKVAFNTLPLLYLKKKKTSVALRRGNGHGENSI